MAEDGGMYQDSLPKQLAALISESSVNASISADSNRINAGQCLERSTLEALRCVMTLDILARSRTRGMNSSGENADGKMAVRNLSNTIFTIGKSIHAFRLILDAGALQQIQSQLIANQRNATLSSQRDERGRSHT